MAQDSSKGTDSPQPAESNDAPSRFTKLRRALLGNPRDLADKSIFHQLSLIPFLAWVGLGADGLSSSAYGPPEAFVALGEHKFLAIGLAAMTMFTIVVISTAYSRIIKAFPHGGGGYVVATHLLGNGAGLLSGAALVVDYVLTITVSLSASGDALFSFLPPHWQSAKLGFEVVLVVLMTLLNMRGVREAVVPLVPVFLLFLVTHLVVIVGGVFLHGSDIPATVASIRSGFHHGSSSLGLVGMLLLFARSYSLGGGTYTGLEAVSNGLPIMREPRVQTAQRTMIYMASSLAFTAGGLLVCYLLAGVSLEEGKTLNAVLTENLVHHVPGGNGFLGVAFVIATLASEGALLMVGAQAGFIDGPRVLSNMALDGWVPRRFAQLSERLTTQNGIALMGLASLAALLYTKGEVSHLVVMYSINVFLTFSLSMAGMLKRALSNKGTESKRSINEILLFGIGLVLCLSILIVTSMEKFLEGGWITLFVTTILVLGCLWIRSHYRKVGKQLAQLDADLMDIPTIEGQVVEPMNPSRPTAVILVGGFNGLGIHTLLNVIRAFRGHYRNLVFISVGVVDSGAFKGEEALHEMKESAQKSLDQYVDLSRRIGLPAVGRHKIGTDVVDVLEDLCKEVAAEFQDVTYFAGQLIFEKESWYHSLLHNQTAFALQKRLQWAGRTMVIQPVRIR
jgi:amino acid transporter